MVNGVYYTALFFYWKEESTIFKRVHKRIFHWVVVKKGLFVPKVGLNFLLCIQKFYGCPSWCWATSISMPFSLQGLYLRNFKLLFNYTQIYFHFFIWLKWFLEQKSKRVQIYFPESRFCGTTNENPNCSFGIKDGFRGNNWSILWKLAPPGYFFVSKKCRTLLTVS